MIYSSIRNKTLRILARVISGIILFIMLLLIVANIYVRYNKQAILEIINSNINKNISGRFEVKDINVSTFTHFPNIAIDLQNIELADSVYHQPLLQCKLLSCRFSIFKLWDVKHQLSKLVLEHGTVIFFTDSTGYSNTSMFKKKEKAPSTAKGKFIVHNVEMRDIAFRVENIQKGKHYDLHFDELSASINDEDSVMQFDVDQKTVIHKLIFNEARGSYLENHTIEGPFNLHFNTITKTLSCDKSEIKINQQEYAITAFFQLSGEPEFHIDAITKKLLYKNGISLLTPKLRQTLGTLQLKAPLDVHASIDGLMKHRFIPLVNINWQTEKNELSAGPVTFKECSFKGAFVNQISDTLPRTDEFSRVVLQTFSGNIDGLQLDGKNIIVTNLLKPYAQFNLTSTALLSQLENRFAFSNIKFLNGTAQVSLLYDGQLIADPALLKNLTAQLDIKDGLMRYEPKDILLEKCSGQVTIGENKLSFKNFQFDLQHSHIEINVSGSDIASFSNLVAGKAALEFNLYSPYLHLDEISGLLSADEKNTMKKNKGQFAAITRSVNELFTTLDFRVNISADTLSRGSFYARNLRANLLFHKDAWQLENISMEHAGGFIQVSGSMVRNHQNQVMLATDVQLQQVNIQQLFHAFDNFGLEGLTANNLRGNLTATGHITAQLYKRKGAVVPGGMNGFINFSLKNGAILNHKGLRQVQLFFLQGRDMSNIRFDELKDKIDIYPNYIYINRMEIQSTAVTMFVEGGYDFNKKNTDILIQVPLSNLSRRDKDYKAKNKGVNAKTGMSALIRAKNDESGNIKLAPTLSKKVKPYNEK
ncbi:MAG TPA: AsmA-like C-terminal region-containing protein [Chitinophagaceae bacterium]|jgi:hypothetical protein